MKIKYIVLTAILATAILFSGSAVKAQTTDVSALIAQLQAQIAQLTAQLKALIAQQGGTQNWCYTFNNNLGYTSTGADVSALQTALTKEGFDVSGDSSGTYGDATASAVSGFQQKYASEILTPIRLKYGTGYVASKTRVKLNSLYGCTTTPPITPTPTQPAITITSPNGGETLNVGQTYDIKWSAPSFNASTSVEVRLSSNMLGNGGGETTIAQTTNTGDYKWTVPADIRNSGYPLLKWWGNEPYILNGSNYKIVVYVNGGGVGNYDSSNNYFNIVAPATPTQSITVVSPNGGETWTMGQTYNIQWSTTGISSSDTVNIMLYSNGDNNVGTHPITLNTPATSGSYSWTVPSLATDIIRPDTKFEIGVNDNDPRNGHGLSANYFNIVAPTTPTQSITVVSPNGGETLNVGQTYDIKWSATSYDPSTSVEIRLSSNQLGGGETTIAQTTNTGDYQWTVPSDITNSGYPLLKWWGNEPHTLNGTGYKIVIYMGNGGAGNYDSSNNPFTIVNSSISTQPSIKTIVNVPLPATCVWGAPCNVMWTSTGLPATTNVSVLLINKPANLYTTLNTNSTVPLSVGFYAWTVPTTVAVGSQYQMRVCALDSVGSAYNMPCNDSSNFSISSVGQ